MIKKIHNVNMYFVGEGVRYLLIFLSNVKMNKKSIIIHNNGGKEKKSNLINLNNKKLFN